VNIVDIAIAATCFGSIPSSANWANCLQFSWNPDPTQSGGGVVNIGDIATMAFYFGHGMTQPFIGGVGLTQLDSGEPQYKVSWSTATTVVRGTTSGKQVIIQCDVKLPPDKCTASSTTPWTITVNFPVNSKVRAFQWWARSGSGQWFNYGVQSFSTIQTSAIGTFTDGSLGTWTMHLQIFDGAGTQIQNVEIVDVVITP
jgi:hypothetical protein